METRKSKAEVKGVVLDASLFQDTSSSSAISYLEKLLHRLFYSHIRLGVLVRSGDNAESCTSQKERIEKCRPSGCSLDLTEASDDRLSEALHDILIAWELSASQCIFVTPVLEISSKANLVIQGWHVCLPSVYSSVEGLSDTTISLIQDLHCQIVCISKESEKEVIVIGYSMKWSRELDFLKRGALPLLITDKNLCFLPVNTELSMCRQFEILDIMLHKPTDEIKSIAFGKTGSLQIRFTDAMQESIRQLSSHPRICVVDPIERVLPLLDRASTLEILQGLSTLEHQFSARIRAPRYKRVLNFDNGKVLEGCDFSLPAIVKFQTACGISDAHTMAVVFKEEGFLNLAVPVPATIQEYIDHGSKVYKFYVVGEEILYAVRKSMPNAANLVTGSSDLNIPAAIVFDSLKSLPKQFVTEDSGVPDDSLLSKETQDGLDLQLVYRAGVWLREKLKLTIFGFDIVIEMNTNDHVIIDVNYFPTFKDVDEKKAVSAFWDALLRAYLLHQESFAAPS